MDHQRPALRFDLVDEDDDEAVLVAPASAAEPGGDPDDDEEQPVAGIEPGILTKAARRARAFLGRQPRRRLVGMAAAAVVVVGAGGGTWADVEHVQHERAERTRVATLLASPGGVRDLSAPLRAAWSVPVDGEVEGTLPGLVVVQDRGDVVAYRVATADGAQGGTEAWRVTLGGDIHCGTGLAGHGHERAPQPKELVCIAGPASARRVTVLTAAGKTAKAATLGDTTGLAVWPGPEGGVVTVRRTGAKPEPRIFSDPTSVADAYPDGMTEGQGAVVTLADATTGRVRWSAELPFRPVRNPETCGVSQVSDGIAPGKDAPEWYEVMLDAQVAVGETYVQVSACGVEGSFLANGVPLDVASGAWVAPNPSGGFLASGQDGASQVFDEHGALAYTVQGNVDVPLAVDGTYPLTMTTSDGAAKRALRDDGTALWQSGSGTGESQAVVTADGVALFMDRASQALTALSTRTGATLWKGAHIQRLGNYWEQDAVTDGRTAVLVVAGEQDFGGTVPRSLDDAAGHLHLLGVDLATGKTWQVDHDGATGAFVVVDGHLLEYDGVQTTEAQRLANGETATTTAGRLSLLVPDAAR